MKQVLGGALAIMAVVAGCSSGATAKAGPSTTANGTTSPVTHAKATSASPSVLPVGRSVVVQDDSGGQVRITVTSIVKRATPPTEASSALQPGQAYVVAHVRFQCVAAGPCTYSQFGDWNAVDPTGAQSDLEAGAVQPALGSGTVATGREVSGYITEDASAKANELTYGSASEPEASWAIR